MKPMTQRPTKEQPMIGWSLEMVLNADHELYRLIRIAQSESLHLRQSYTHTVKASFNPDPGSIAFCSLSSSNVPRLISHRRPVAYLNAI